MGTQIVLRQGLSWEALPAGSVRVVVNQAELLNRLAELRDQWEEATDGEMENATVNLRFLFNDLASMIMGVTP